MDELVERMCPPGFDVVRLARDAGAEDRHRLLASAEFLLGSWVTTAVTLTEDDYCAAPNLKLLQLMSAGYEHVDLALAARHGVPVAHFGDAMASTVAEHAVLLILAVFRRLLQLDAAVRAGAWRTGEPTLYELRGKRVGIVGLGKIGAELARRVAAFDAEVVYFSRHPVEGAEARCLPFDRLLASSDVVSLNVPLSSATRGLIGERELGLMKPDAVLINTSRGPVLDEAALARALEAGRLRGAGLDVLEPEPPAPDNPLLRLPNVVLTPHDSGVSAEVWPRVVAACFENIERVGRGEPPRNLALPLD